MVNGSRRGQLTKVCHSSRWQPSCRHFTITWRCAAGFSNPLIILHMVVVRELDLKIRHPFFLMAAVFIIAFSMGVAVGSVAGSNPATTITTDHYVTVATTTFVSHTSESPSHTSSYTTSSRLWIEQCSTVSSKWLGNETLCGGVPSP